MSFQNNNFGKLIISIERDEFIVMMNKLTDRPKEYAVKTTFYDLSPNEWNYQDMMNASNYVIQKQ